MILLKLEVLSIVCCIHRDDCLAVNISLSYDQLRYETVIGQDTVTCSSA